MHAIPNAKRSKRGFSLVELLVVIAILAVTAGILFVVIGGSKDKAHGAEARSNLRQVFLATQLYVDEHDGWSSLPNYATMDRHLQEVPTCDQRDTWRSGCADAYTRPMIGSFGYVRGRPGEDDDGRWLRLGPDEQTLTIFVSIFESDLHPDPFSDVLCHPYREGDATIPRRNCDKPDRLLRLRTDGSISSEVAGGPGNLFSWDTAFAYDGTDFLLD